MECTAVFFVVLYPLERVREAPERHRHFGERFGHLVLAFFFFFFFFFFLCWRLVLPTKMSPVLFVRVAREREAPVRRLHLPVRRRRGHPEDVVVVLFGLFGRHHLE